MITKCFADIKKLADRRLLVHVLCIILLIIIFIHNNTIHFFLQDDRNVCLMLHAYNRLSAFKSGKAERAAPERRPAGGCDARSMRCPTFRLSKITP